MAYQYDQPTGTKVKPGSHQEITLRILRDWEHSEYARDNGARDLIFARRTQWDDELDQNVETEYRGQFDIVKPERRRILAALMKNEFNNRYRAKDPEDEKLAEVLQNLYRATVRTNDARMAAEVAISEAIDCGKGAWRMEVVDEDDEDPLNTNKKIVRSVIHEANNKVVWDANSKKIDKSDAKTCTIVFAYSRDSWKELMKEHGLEPSESQFELPDYLSRSTLCWRQAENYTIAEHYKVKETKQKMTIMSDGENLVALTTGELRKKGDALRGRGYEKEATKTVVKRSVWKTILTGAHIIEHKKIAGKHIPVVQLFGEWSITQSTESWEGLVRMLRDPQQIKNTTMSYIFDLLAKGPIEKDIYTQEQIDGYEEMYEEQNKYKHPYYLQNMFHPDTGEPLPMGPIGKKGGPQIPQAAQFLLQAADQAVSQSVGGGISPEQMINPQVTDDQLLIIQEQLDIQSQLYKEHLEYAYRREGQICASIWAEIIDTEQTLNIMKVDGTEDTVDVNKVTADISTMTMKVEIDMSKADMDVFTDVGVSFKTQKDMVRNEMMALLEKPISQQDQQIAQWTYIMNLEGSAYEPMRKNARKQMVMAKYIDDDDLTDEEKQMMAELANQPPQKDPQAEAMMVAAQAEDKKGQADMMDSETKSKEADVKMYLAELKEMELQLKAQELGIKLETSISSNRNKDAGTAKIMRDIQSKDVDDMVKVKDSQTKQQDSFAKMLQQPISV